MKKNLFFLSVILFVFISATALFSCSKEKVVPVPAPADKGILIDNIAERRGPVRGGSVSGVLLPENAVVKIAISNGNFYSDAFYYTRPGNFRIDYIPDGMYMLSVKNTATFAVYIIEQVKVKTGVITNIGSIIIQ
jgi:hypothetical protein